VRAHAHLLTCRVGGAAAGFACPHTSSTGVGNAGDEGDGFEEDGSPRSHASSSGGCSGLSLLAHELVGVAAQLGMQLETFSVGTVAHQLGQYIWPSFGSHQCKASTGSSQLFHGLGTFCGTTAHNTVDLESVDGSDQLLTLGVRGRCAA